MSCWSGNNSSRAHARPCGCSPAAPACPPQSFKAFADKVNEAGGQAELHIFKDCGHAFLNTGAWGGARPASRGSLACFLPTPPPTAAGSPSSPRPPPLCHAAGDEGVAKRQHMGFPEPPQDAQEQAWKNLFDFFGKHLKE